MRDVRESMAAQSPEHGGTGSRDDAEQSHSACVHREATGRNPLLSARTQEHDDAGHAAGNFEGVDASMVPIGDDKTPCL